MRNPRYLTAAICAVLLGAMTACHTYYTPSSQGTDSGAGSSVVVTAEAAQVEEEASVDAEAASEKSSTEKDSSANAGTSSDSSAAESASSDSSGNSALDTSSLFSDRDLEQTADLTGAQKIIVKDGETTTISSEGVYVISGTASNAQILVAAGDEDKVQLVLDGVTITNDSTPCIYVQNADKVFVTTTSSESSLSVTGTFTADGDTNTDAVIFSRDDVVLNGTGTLNIASTDNGISSKDDVKVTGGTINITCTSDALEANESILMADGTVTIKSQKDGLHAENDEDNTVGYVYIGGGKLTIDAADDAIHATTIAQIDGGTIDLTAREGIEGTYIQINDGTVSIAASDDGINAGQKSNISTPTVEVNGGEITIAMGAGDTDAVDSNGNLVLNGGTLDITAQSPFDYDGTAQNNGTTLIVNGTQTDTITNQMMGGGMHGGMGGNADSPFGGGKHQRGFPQDGQDPGMNGNMQGGPHW